MSSDDQNPHKRSKVHSTVAHSVRPYRIPEGMVSNTRHVSFLHDSKASAVENYVFKTKMSNESDSERTVEFRKSLKPKVENKLHLDLPTEKKVQVRKYVGQEKHFEHTVRSFFAKIFKSCVTPETSQDFQECDYCEKRYTNEDEIRKRTQEEKLAKEMSIPYVSYRRLTERQKQPIQVFYQEITNEPIKNNRWKTDQSEFKNP